MKEGDEKPTTRAAVKSSPEREGTGGKLTPHWRKQTVWPMGGKSPPLCRGIAEVRGGNWKLTFGMHKSLLMENDFKYNIAQFWKFTAVFFSKLFLKQIKIKKK